MTAQEIRNKLGCSFSEAKLVIKYCDTLELATAWLKYYGCAINVRPKDNETKEEAFMQRVLAYYRRCDDISRSMINDDSEKYFTVRHSMALRVIGLYVATQHFIDASSELRFLERELKIVPDDPLIGFTHSAVVALQSVPREHSEPAKEMSFTQLFIPYE